jgi:hypothetical protein
MAEFPKKNIDNGSQCNVQKKCTKCKKSFVYKIDESCKILYKTESLKKKGKGQMKTEKWCITTILR